MKIKVFKSGKYPQGEYDKEKVKNIFSKAKETDAIFLHTSLWAKDEKPLNLGKFNNYEFKESNGEVEVFADLELNETMLIGRNAPGSGFNDWYWGGNIV